MGKNRDWLLVKPSADTVFLESTDCIGCLGREPKMGRDEPDTYSPAEVKVPIDGNPEDFTLIPHSGDPEAPHHHVTVVDDKGRRVGTFDINAYAMKKTAAQGLLDLALLMANASQLKSIIQTNGNHQFYLLMLILLSISIAMQIIVGLCLLFLGRKRISADTSTSKLRSRTASADRLNNWVVAGIFVLTVVNVFIASFGLNNNIPVHFDERRP